MVWKSIKSGCQSACSAVFDFTYPPHCLACDCSTSDGAIPLCSLCAELLEPIELSERCPTCFSERYGENATCQRCVLKASLWDGKAAAFAYRDTAAILVRQLKYGNKPHLARGAAAYMAVQAHRLQWPVPDYIIPVPMPWPRRLERGYNQSVLLADVLVPLWGGVVCDVMIRDAGEWSQAGLAAEQRRELTSERFRVRKGADLSGKAICLIDDVTTTGSTLEACAEALLKCDIGALYALTLCCAEKQYGR